MVLLHPKIVLNKKSKKGKANAQGGFVVRLLPCCGRDVMAPARLVPGRNNVRTRQEERSLFFA